MSHIASRNQYSRNVTSGWLTFGFEVVLAFALTPLIIRELGVASYGVWSLMMSVIGYMGLIDVGIRGSVGRYINHYLALQNERALEQVVSTALTILTGLGLIAVAASAVIGWHFLEIFPKTPPPLGNAISICLPLLAVGLWLSFISSVLANLLAAREALYINNYIGLGLVALRAAGTIYVLVKGHGLLGLISVSIIAQAFGALATWFFARELFKHAMPRLVGFHITRLREMWRFGVASFVSRSASTMANDSAPIIGMWLLGPEAVAVYSVAMTLTQYARRLMEQTSSAIYPSVMKAGALRDYSGLRAIYLRFMDVSFAVGSLIFVGMMVLGGSFLALWAGPEYSQGSSVVVILAIGYLLQSIASTGPHALASLDKVHITMRISIAEALGCLLLSAVLPGLFGLGLSGLALGATIPRLLFGCLLYPWLAVSTLGHELKPDLWRNLRRNALMCIAVAAVFWSVHHTMPSSSWLTLGASAVIITLLHLAAFGDRYEIASAGWFRNALLSGWHRFTRKQHT